MAQLLNTMVDGNLQVTGNIDVNTPLEVELGGTNSKTYKEARKQILGYNPSMMRLTKNSTEDTTIGTSFTYFKTSYGTEWVSDSQGDLFVKTSKTFSYEGHSSTATGIMLALNAPAGYVRVFGSIRYLKTTSATAHIQTSIVRLRDNVCSNMTWISGTYDGLTNHRIGHTLNQIVYMEPGDFLFIGGWKSTATTGLKILTDNYTKWGVEYIAKA